MTENKIQRFVIGAEGFDEQPEWKTDQIGPWCSTMIDQFREQYGSTEITEKQMSELFGFGEMTTVGDLDSLQLLQFAFASALRSNEALLRQKRLDELKAGVEPFMNRQQRRHGGR